METEFPQEKTQEFCGWMVGMAAQPPSILKALNYSQNGLSDGLIYAVCVLLQAKRNDIYTTVGAKNMMLSDKDTRQRSRTGLCLQKMSGIGDYENKSPFLVAKGLEEDGDCQWVWGALFEG